MLNTQAIDFFFVRKYLAGVFLCSLVLCLFCYTTQRFRIERGQACNSVSCYNVDPSQLRSLIGYLLTRTFCSDFLYTPINMHVFQAAVFPFQMNVPNTREPSFPRGFMSHACLECNQQHHATSHDVYSRHKERSLSSELSGLLWVQTIYLCNKIISYQSTHQIKTLIVFMGISLVTSFSCPFWQHVYCFQYYSVMMLPHHLSQYTCHEGIHACMLYIHMPCTCMYYAHVCLFLFALYIGLREQRCAQGCD